MPFWGLYPMAMGWKSEEEEVRPKNIRRHLRHAPVQIWPCICSIQLLRTKGKVTPLVCIHAYACAPICEGVKRDGRETGESDKWAFFAVRKDREGCLRAHGRRCPALYVISWSGLSSISACK